MQTPALLVEEVKKSYGNVEALRGVSFDVKSGSVCGLLGPNGAGKSTLMRCIVTLLRQDTGRITVLGHDTLLDARNARRKLGYAAQQTALDKALTGREMLEMQGAIYHVPQPTLRSRIDEVLALVGLSDVANRRTGTYSGGMARRLDLATALLHQPAMLVLDEPTVGLDIHTRSAIWDFIRKLAAGGTAVLIATHHLEEVEALADDIVIIDHGKVISRGTSEALKQQYKQHTLDEVFLQATGHTLRDEPWLAQDTPPARRRR